jgi:hypothetical protein
MFEVVPVQLWHLNALCPPTTEEERIQNEVRAIIGVGCTGVADGYIVGAAGIVKTFGTTGVAWSYITEEIAAKHKFSLHKNVKRLFPVLAKIKGIETIYAQADPRNLECNCQWLKRLGFTRTAKGFYQWTSA